MTKFTEGRHVGEFILSEANFHRSRGKGIVVAGSGLIKSGHVLGVVGLGAATAAAKSGGNTGTGTVSAVTIQKGAKQGVYVVRFTGATTFNVEDPDGNVITSGGATGVAQTDDIGFTITAGGTAFVAGDGFDITVALGTLKLAPSPDTVVQSTAGAENATCISITEGDATSADLEVALIERAAEVKGFALTYDSSVNTDPKKLAKQTQLKAAGIIVR